MAGRGGGGRALSAPVVDGLAPEATDFANYFCTYAYLYHQKDMLEDVKRTSAYYNAVMNNRAQFANKVVLDVGTGSGVLALFAAKAGARKAYAVEATDMAQHARVVVKANGCGEIIEVIQGMIESVQIPEKVDIIISEWMGYFLLRESMLDSVLVARDRFLKPGGALYPSHARMYLAAARSSSAHERRADLEASMEGWSEFCQNMHRFYGMDLSCLSKAYREEQREYFIATATWSDIHPSQLVGPPAMLKQYDLLTVSKEELEAPLKSHVELRVLDSSHVDGFVGYFDTQFRGSPENPTDNEVLLTTAPDATGATHWGQQMFFMDPSIPCESSDVISVDLEVRRKAQNHRLMHVKIDQSVIRPSKSMGPSATRTSLFSIE